MVFVHILRIFLPLVSTRHASSPVSLYAQQNKTETDHLCCFWNGHFSSQWSNTHQKCSFFPSFDLSSVLGRARGDLKRGNFNYLWPTAYHNSLFLFLLFGKCFESRSQHCRGVRRRRGLRCPSSSSLLLLRPPYVAPLPVALREVDPEHEQWPASKQRKVTILNATLCDLFRTKQKETKHCCHNCLYRNPLHL